MFQPPQSERAPVSLRPTRVGLSAVTMRPAATELYTYLGGLLSGFDASPLGVHVTMLASTVPGLELPRVPSSVSVAYVAPWWSWNHVTARASAIGESFVAAGCPPARRTLDLDVLHYPLTLRVPRVQASLPTAVTLHDVQHLDLAHFSSPAQRLWRRYSYDHAARCATLVITVSEHARGRIVERLGVDTDRIVVARHGIDTLRFGVERNVDDERFERSSAGSCLSDSCVTRRRCGPTRTTKASLRRCRMLRRETSG